MRRGKPCLVEKISSHERVKDGKITTMVNDPKWNRAWAKFIAYRDNLPDSFDEEEVDKYHKLVSSLQEASGENLADFRIPKSEMKPKVVAATLGSRRRPGRVTYSPQRYCDRRFIQQQIDGIVHYFQSLQPPRKKPGFRR